MGPPIVPERLLLWKGLYGMVGAGERVLGKHRLIIEIITRQAVEFIRTGFVVMATCRPLPRPYSLVVGVDLICCFLNDVGVGDQIQYTLSDAARDVQAVNGPHVRNGSLTVGADVNGGLRGEIVDA